MQRILRNIPLILLLLFNQGCGQGVQSKAKDQEELNKIYDAAIYIIKGKEIEREKVGYTFGGQIVTFEEGRRRMKEQKGDIKHVMLTRYQARVRMDKVIMGDMSTLEPHLRNGDSEVVLEWGDVEHSASPHIPDEKEFREGIWCWLKPTDEHGLGNTVWLPPEVEEALSEIHQNRMQNRREILTPAPHTTKHTGRKSH